ncbi:hypothetical protein HIM_02820 [Hirsutella minnesotensis 3608]|nr:hypothetical protein HIM_02820 [Hirsutella minnesotensis 3608]
MLGKIQYGTAVLARSAGRPTLALRVPSRTAAAALRSYGTKKVATTAAAEDGPVAVTRRKVKKTEASDKGGTKIGTSTTTKGTGKSRTKKQAETSEDTPTPTPPTPETTTKNIKKPRGRRKQSDAHELGSSGAKGPEETKQVELGEGTIKRKRGRPRKIVPDVKPENDKQGDSSEGTKKRGRRGSKTATDEPANTATKGEKDGHASVGGGKLKGANAVDAQSDLIQKLDDMGVGHNVRRRSGARILDPRRVNVVSQELCDDIIKYLGPSLEERHRGCDIIDLNPGAGLWSRKLHDHLQPRRHLMMDIDAELYRPFMGDLLSRPNVELIPKSGIVWKDLIETMRERLPEQSEVDRSAEPTRNDTLLVTANLSVFPKRAFQGFESVSIMVLYQFLSTIRTSALFQRYGLVRMLVWINDEDKKRLLPRTLNRRRRSAFEAQLSCEWIHEVAGLDSSPLERTSLRDYWITKESDYNMLQRMEAAGLTMPRGRESKAYLEAKAEPALMGQKLAGVREPLFSRPFKSELEGLEQAASSGASGEESSARLKILQKRDSVQLEVSKMYLELLQQYEELERLAPKGGADQVQEAPGAVERAARERHQERAQGVLGRPRQLPHLSPGPARPDVGPAGGLSVRADEFFPATPTALLDLQPKAMHPLLREYGPQSSRSGDMSDAMLRCWFQVMTLDFPRAMDSIWGGFGELAAECPSVMRWPFRPPYVSMLTRLVEDDHVDDDDETIKPGATGSLM